MDPDLFLSDLERKPRTLRYLADQLDDGAVLPPMAGPVRRVVLLGMGSSRYAALDSAQRLRRQGLDAVAEYSSAAASHPGGPETLVVGISASGGTEETVAALAAHRGRSRTVAMTNTADSPISEAADLVVPMLAGEEVGGVACRSFQHTQAVLLALGGALTGHDVPAARWCRAAAEATADLLERRDEWLAHVRDVLDEDDRTFVLAPAERRASAEQSALMLREGPRRQADACETGDWLHVDVYLTKPLPYRALVYTGSAFEPGVVSWMQLRGGRYVAVGGEMDGAATIVRHRHDDDPVVRSMTEVLVAELLAAAWWKEADPQ